jgi:hypothetical protein
MIGEIGSGRSRLVAIQVRQLFRKLLEWPFA